MVELTEHNKESYRNQNKNKLKKYEDKRNRKTKKD